MLTSPPLCLKKAYCLLPLKTNSPPPLPPPAPMAKAQHAFAIITAFTLFIYVCIKLFKNEIEILSTHILIFLKNELQWLRNASFSLHKYIKQIITNKGIADYLFIYFPDFSSVMEE